jgi:quercetin dioxygenase-like cupin family protein
MADTFQIVRIYAGPDGKSRQEPIEVPLGTAKFGLVSKLFSGAGVEFHRQPPGGVASWHTAPRRQLIATISGEAEIETGDGKVLRSRPGVVHLVEDLTGQGHITRIVGAEDRVSLFMPLGDSTELA